MALMIQVVDCDIDVIKVEGRPDGVAHVLVLTDNATGIQVHHPMPPDKVRKLQVLLQE